MKIINNELQTTDWLIKLIIKKNEKITNTRKNKNKFSNNDQQQINNELIENTQSNQ